MVGILISSVVLTAGSLSAGDVVGSALAPQLLDRVSSSSTVAVVSTSVKFESSNPAACHYQSCFTLQRTSDNGATFTTGSLPAVAVAVVNGSLLGDIRDVIFASQDDGFILQGSGPVTTLKVTVDGAKTWHSERIAPNVSIVDFTTTHHELYAVIAHCAANGRCTDYRIARSPLTANHWTFTPLATWPSGMGVGLGAYGSHVWLTQQTHATVLVYASDDQGRTFTRSSAPMLGSVYACSITAKSTIVLWAECPTGMSVSFFYSRDGGVRWNRIPVTQFAGTGGGAFDPVSSTIGYLEYGPSDTPGTKNLYRITDDGRTMTPVGTLACNIVNGLVFTDEMHGLAACDRSNTQATTYLLRTSDGGATWKRVNLT